MRMDPIAAKRAQLIEDDTYVNDLARFCLEMDPAESRRTLAWVNSICAIYLVIGIIGLRPPPLDITRQAATQEEAVPTVIEPLVAAVQSISPDSSPEMSDKAPDEAGGVAVTIDSPDISFSVPTVGNILVSANMAQPPPAHPMQAVASISAAHIELINVTGMGGSRSPPLYPRDSALRGEQGTVTILLEVEDSGRISSVTVKESSGFPTLDRAATMHAQRAWFFPPGKGQRMFECPIIFQLQ